MTYVIIAHWPLLSPTGLHTHKTIKGTELITVKKSQLRQTDNLQWALNISDTSKNYCDLMRRLHDELKWVDVRDQVTLYTVIIVNRRLCSCAPQYTAIHCVSLFSQRHLHSAEKNVLHLPCHRLNMYAVVRRTAANLSLLVVRLSVHNRNATEGAFRRLLKIVCMVIVHQTNYKGFHGCAT